MYPYIKIGNFTFWTFGITLSLSLILFFWMLFKTTKKNGININFFILWFFGFFISTFIFARLFYVIAQWRDFEFLLDEPLRSSIPKFLLTSDYSMSLMWWIIWFVLVLIIKIKKYHLNIEKYLDCIVLSFFFAAILWYFWAFLGWQIYGKPTTLPIWITYNSSDANIPFYGEVFPLAIIYSIVSFLIFVFLYMQRIITKADWKVWYLGIFIFSIALFVLEFFNWDIDIFESFIKLDMNQLWAIILFLISFRWLKKVKKQNSTVSI